MTLSGGGEEGKNDVLFTVQIARHFMVVENRGGNEVGFTVQTARHFSLWSRRIGKK